MPATLTYNPSPLQNPAGILRADPCDPRRHMNPLAGIRATHRTTLGYREAFPDGDSPPFRITATHPVVPPINYESCIMHCYTFSAKERDSETGLNYFGSRYYSSDLSVWLSMDPMSDKYPSLSPYVYCANNPVKLVDPNGETFVGVDGENVEVNRNKNGQISVGDNASEDLKRMASMINSSGSKTAAKQFMKLSKNECKIHFQIVQGDGDGGKLGYHQAHGENGEPLEWNADQGVFSDLPGYANNTTYKEATITIFENAVDKSKGQFSYQDKKPLTTENAMVAVFAHEAEHNLNKLDILSIKYATVGGGMNSRNVERNAERG